MYVRDPFLAYVDETVSTIQEADVSSDIDSKIKAVVDMLQSLQLQVETDQPRLETLQQLEKDLHKATMTFQAMNCSSGQSYSMPSKKINIDGL